MEVANLIQTAKRHNKAIYQVWPEGIEVVLLKVSPCTLILISASRAMWS